MKSKIRTYKIAVGACISLSIIYWFASPSLYMAYLTYAPRGTRVVNMPIPDYITFHPMFKQTADKTDVIVTKVEVRKELELLIVKKVGKYYWVSNQNKELTVITDKFDLGGLRDLLRSDLENKPSFFMDKTKKMSGDNTYTIFKSVDGSGLIIIQHDKRAKAECWYGSYPGTYIEMRFDEGVILGGKIGAFPPKPKNWCDGTPYF